MLWHKVQGGKFSDPPAYVGSVDAAHSSAGGWSLDVMSIASTGDLVVIAFTFDGKADSVWSWSGMNITAMDDQTASTSPGAYVGYGFVQAGDSNPVPVGVSSTNWAGLSVVAAVFEGVTGYVADLSTGNRWSGTPNPPALTADGNLWICSGHFEDDPRELNVPPSGYTLAGSSYYSSSQISTTALAYKISTLSADDPGLWGSTDGGFYDAWRATTAAFT